MHRGFKLFSHRVLTRTSNLRPRTSTILRTELGNWDRRNNGFGLFRAFMYTFTQNRRVQDPNDPATLMKEDGVSVSSQMWIENFREPEKTVTNLSDYLRRFELWVLAYQKVAADETGAYVPRSSITRATLEDLLALRNAVLDNRFKWGARLEFFIKSPRDKTDYESLSKRKIRAIMTTTQPAPFQDRIVQEVLFLILEPVYEARFSQKSFAFRPGRTAHTVIRVIRRSFAGYLWYIKGDLSTVLDGMKVGLVISALMRDIRDKKVIDLIKAALTTPVITSKVEEPKKKKRRKYQKKRVLAEDEPKPDPYWLVSFFGFAPEEAEKVPSWGHCGILSPLLANVCLDELDRWMEGKIKEFYRPSKSDVIWNSPEGEVEQGNTSWPEFVPTSGPDKTRKIDYIRYGGHILIGVRGPRADAATLRKQLIEFCDQKYMLKLDNEDLPIEHITKGIMFLDHVLCRRVVYPTLRYTATGGKIISEKGVGTLLSVTASLKQSIKQFRKLGFLKGDRDPDPQPCFRMFHATQAHTNAQMNKLLSTMVEWYRYADNRKKIVNFCSYIIRGSLAKLYAAKYKLRSRAKVYKIGSRNLSRPLKEKKGQSPEYHNLLRMGLVESIDGLQYTRMSLVPETDYSPFPVGWRPDHEKALLEYIWLDDPRTLEEQRRCLGEHGLISPQDYISMLVWNYKRNAIPMDQLSIITPRDNRLLCSSNEDSNDERNSAELDNEESIHAAQM
ncbi:nuclear intron maturase 2, mitochondrial [Coffea eugenioides]|uniref:Nuclear intron maturase 2, mitochondrial n=1 Tax=Coffea arabica TaxID=13443 RepID=A0A6P6V9P0_COFAR|nr:nuclear intron maturase 2, mitochondrial-like [Coffea arabica]XP_027098682.1 nuclear intron maturase 2, mitochondrial-like [Coffea arabica]XP_027151233.1 nuclear intron maturase 2, mitochondrial [Coffea eugenioides]